MEIISASSESRNREFKFRLYAREGVKKYWIVDPDAKSIEIYQLKQGGFVPTSKFSGKEDVTSPLFGGLQFICNRVFK